MSLSVPTWIRDLKPERFFVITALLFGLAFAILTPPLQVPDEDFHYFRAYQVSGFGLLPDIRESHAGGTLPQSVIDLVYKDFGNRVVLFGPNNKFGRSKVSDLLLHNRSPKVKRWVHFEAEAIYSPVPYLPQAFGIGIGRVLRLPALVGFYLGRLANLAFWAFLVYWAIRKMPIGKWAMALLALEPMSIFQSSTMSADALTNGLAFFFIAYVLMVALQAKRPVKRLDMIILAVSALALALAKESYYLVDWLLLLIPIARFETRKLGQTFRAAVLGLGALMTAAWAYHVRRVDINLSWSLPSDTPNLQMKWLLLHPLQFAFALLNSMFSNLSDNLLSGLVSIDHWVDVAVPFWAQIGGAFMVFAALWYMNTPDSVVRRVAKVERWFLALVGVLTAAAILLALYLYTAPVGADAITQIQGRYFIPLLPLLIPLLYFGRPAISAGRRSLVLLLSWGILLGNLLPMVASYYRI